MSPYTSPQQEYQFPSNGLLPGYLPSLNERGIIVLKMGIEIITYYFQCPTISCILNSLNLSYRGILF